MLQQNIRNQWRMLLALLLMFVVLTACSRQEEPEPLPTAVPTAMPPPPPTATTAPTAIPTAGADSEAGLDPLSKLTDVQWVLVAYGDPASPTVVMEETLVTLFFAESGAVAGAGGCSNYSATFEAAASGALSINNLSTGQSACARGMEQEQIFLSALAAARQFGFDDQDRLRIDYGSAGEAMTLVRGAVPLAGTPWTLIAFGDAEAPPRVEAGTAITAFFSEADGTNGTVTGFGGCNEYTAGYMRGLDTLTVENPVTTRHACAVGVEQENDYLQALATASNFRVAGQLLEVNYDGGVLVYRASGLPLTNILWRLVAVDGELVPENTPITVVFLPGEEPEEGEVRGTAGCAAYLSTYRREESALTIAAPESAGEVCTEPFPYEEAFLEALSTATDFAIFGEQMALVAGERLLAFAAYRAPLELVAWELVSFGSLLDPEPLPQGAALRALFIRAPDRPSGLMVGETACNSFSATYAAGLEEIGINRPVRTAGQACTAQQLAQEEQLLQLLSGAGQYRILGNNLQIGSGDAVLNFSVAWAQEEVPALKALDGTRWYLLSLYDRPVRDGTEITAAFAIDDSGATGTISGSAGCNSYNGQINGDLNVEAVITSRQACATPPGVMEQEATYLEALLTVEGHLLSDNQLLLTTPQGVIVFATQPAQPSGDQSPYLRDVIWYLHSYGTTPVGGAGADATIAFDARGNLTGNTGCNSFNGSYTTSGQQMEIGTLDVTRAACAEPLASQEAYMLSTLQGAQSYLIAASHLQIRSSAGVLNFSWVPPAGGNPPIPVIQAPDSTQVGQAITFDATASTHSRPIVAFRWNFGDGSRASGPVVEHAYGSAGTYVAELVLIDDRGFEAVATQRIVVSAAETSPPTAVISGPASARVEETVIFSASGTGAGSGGGPLSYTWYLGDGAVIDSGAATDVSYVYGVPGDYVVSVLVTAADGSSDSASIIITVEAGLEQTSWTWSNGPAPITIRFAGGTVTGFAGCNNYNATYTLQGDQIAITQPFAGDNQCPPDVMEQERQFLTALAQVTAYQINGTVLTLITAEGQSIVFYAQN